MLHLKTNPKTSVDLYNKRFLVYITCPTQICRGLCSPWPLRNPGYQIPPSWKYTIWNTWWSRLQQQEKKESEMFYASNFMPEMLGIRNNTHHFCSQPIIHCPESATELNPNVKGLEGAVCCGLRRVGDLDIGKQ